MKTIVVLALLAAFAAAGVYGQTASVLTIEFDNRGSKVMDKSTNAKIIKALAEHVFKVPANQVALAGGIGQSSLINHKSTVVYVAQGPTFNGKSTYANCQAAAKAGWVRSSALSKALKKATDTWLPGDSVKVKRASCAVPTGRKMAL